MTNRPTREDLIAAARAGGWGWFDGVQAHLAATGSAPAATPETAGRRRALAEATARLFDSEDGQILLEHWLDATFRRVVFFTQLGLDPQQSLIQGAFREGMCAFVAENLKLIAEGRAEPAPKTRER